MQRLREVRHVLVEAQQADELDVRQEHDGSYDVGQSLVVRGQSRVVAVVIWARKKHTPWNIIFHNWMASCTSGLTHIKKNNENMSLIATT